MSAILNAALECLSPETLRIFIRWKDILYNHVEFNRPQSTIHATGHCERVLLHALALCEKEMPDNPAALEILAQAAVFHDSKRIDDYMDTGHGARAAAYYTDFCREHPDIIHFHPETECIMSGHDRPDNVWTKIIMARFGNEAKSATELYHIFKDADALDRWRLGDFGLDPKFLRTDSARKSIDFARRLVEETVDASLLRLTDSMVREALRAQGLLPPD